jgi:hypothetical protein
VCVAGLFCYLTLINGASANFAKRRAISVLPQLHYHNGSRRAEAAKQQQKSELAVRTMRLALG